MNNVNQHNSVAYCVYCNIAVCELNFDIIQEINVLYKLNQGCIVKCEHTSHMLFSYIWCTHTHAHTVTHACMHAHTHISHTQTKHTYIRTF